MNYDSSISSEVPLSKVLDEMIVDGTPLDVVETFLKGHESAIPEIFAHSSMAYDLYDSTNCDRFLLENIAHLPLPDAYFAASIQTAWRVEMKCHPEEVELIRGICREKMDAKLFVRAGWDGDEHDRDILYGERTLVEHLNSMRDYSDMRHFVTHSHFVKSAFMAKKFLQLNPSTQFILLKTLSETCAATRVSSRYLRGWDVRTLMNSTMGSLVASLLRQLVELDDREMFDWVVGVVNSSSYTMMDVDNVLMSKFPESMVKILTEGSFPEVVFEMNLLGGEVSSRDLFIHIYMADPTMLKDMMENSDMIEFFNLPFDWTALEKFKGKGKKGVA